MSINYICVEPYLNFLSENYWMIEKSRQPSRRTIQARTAKVKAITLLSIYFNEIW